ncbi:MAG: PAS domain S-box protein, partial [Planctomycetaceae bacterium]|nr:PAS domain S-box protein [Planctomycetaceae bacterium]
MSIEAYLQVIESLPEATLLLSGGGIILAANQGVASLLGLGARGLEGRRLADIVGDDPDAVARYLRLCSRSREAVLASLRLLGEGGREVACRGEGAVLRPRSEGTDGLLLVRLIPKTVSIRQFIALNERIDALSREIVRRIRVEQALHDQREWLRVTLASIGDAVIATDREGRVAFMNRAAEVLTGWSQEEATGEPLGWVFHVVEGASRERIEDPVGRVLHRDIAVGLAEHTVLIARDGTERSIEDTAAPIREEGGELKGVVLVFHDVTARRLAEEAVRASEARKDAILQSALDGIIGMDHEGRVVEFNPSAERLFGYRRDEILGRPLAELIIPPALRERYRRGLSASLATGEGPVIGRRIEFPALRADGTEFPAELALTRVPAAGPPQFTGFIRDLTEQKRAERALWESEQRLHLALDASQLGTFHWDLSSGSLTWNARCREHFGVSPDAEVTLDLFYDRLHPDDRERTRQAVARAIEDRAEYDIEFRSVDRQGRTRWIHAKGRVFDDPSGQPCHFHGTTIDVTGRKRQEQDLLEAKEAAEAASRAREQFLAVLSHELRTPLTPVLATVTALEARRDLPPGLDDEVAMIRRNVEAETRLIDDLLDLTRLIRGKIALHEEVLDVHDALHAALAACRGDIEAKRIVASLDLGARSHHVRADRVRIHKVFRNLIDNAVKFTPEGGRIGLLTADDVPGVLVVRISDNGVGIEPEALARIFDAFEQAERTLTRRFGGLGLGLAISRRLVEMHQGSLTASSAGRDQGATFTLRLPTIAPPAAPGRPTRPSSSPRSEGLRILLVEDHDDTLRTMSRLLR